MFLGAIVEYNDELPFVSLTEFPLPNVNLAAEGQPEEIGKKIYFSTKLKLFNEICTIVYYYFRPTTSIDIGGGSKL